jgi:membrane fusion protein, multidrug efflux system
MNDRIAMLATLLVLGSAAGCRREAAIQTATPEEAVPVRTVRVGGGGGEWIEVPGTVEAMRAADLASRFSAVIEEVKVEEGAFVHAGDLLVRLDGRDLQARAAGAEAALHAARAQRDRLRALLDKGAATRQELDAAEAADAVAAAERDAARSQIEYVDLRAPFDGVITDKRVRAGDLAIPGETLLALQGVGRLRVSASLSKAQADPLEAGEGIEAVLEDGASVTTHVSVLGPAGDPGSRRFLVKCDLPKGARASVGSFVRLRLPRGEEQPQAFVPVAAIFERGALTGVYVVEEGRARLRWISPGEKVGESILARAGLIPGDEVIVHPPALRDGAPVRVETPAP